VQSARSAPHSIPPGPALCNACGVGFELRLLDTGKLVHDYNTEDAALAFVRDVVRVGGREQAARFVLEERAESGETRTVAHGAALVQLAIEDRAE
jgi:hypothetical protein